MRRLPTLNAPCSLALATPTCGCGSTSWDLSWEWSGRPEEAIAAFGRAARLQPVNILAYVNLAGLLANLGREDEAQVNLNKTLELNPTFSIEGFRANAYTLKPVPLSYREQIIAGLRKVGAPE
jgi:tetratricopeptide (TPR) repeat protein